MEIKLPIRVVAKDEESSQRYYWTAYVSNNRELTFRGKFYVGNSLYLSDSSHFHINEFIKYEHIPSTLYLRVRSSKKNFVYVTSLFNFGLHGDLHCPIQKYSVFLSYVGKRVNRRLQTVKWRIKVE